MNKQNSDIPLVSIIVPSYNHEKFVKKTLQSIFDQTYENIEIIIIDDCSTDSTVKIIQEELENYKGKHTFIRKEKNKGVCDSLRQGILLSKGEYIIPFSSDDVLLKTSAQDRVNFLEANKEYAFVHTDADIIDDNDNLWSESEKLEVKREALNIIRVRTKYIESNRMDFLEYMLRFGNVIIGPNVMWRREANDITITYDDKLPLIQDYDVWLRSLIKYKWGYLPKKTVQYRLHSSNTNKSLPSPELRSRYTHQFSIMFAKLYDEIIILPDRNYQDKLLNLLFPYAYHYWFNAGNSEYEKKARKILFKKSDKNTEWYKDYSLKFRIRALFKGFMGIEIKNVLDYLLLKSRTKH